MQTPSAMQESLVELSIRLPADCLDQREAAPICCFPRIMAVFIVRLVAASVALSRRVKLGEIPLTSFPVQHRYRVPISRRADNRTQLNFAMSATKASSRFHATLSMTKQITLTESPSYGSLGRPCLLMRNYPSCCQLRPTKYELSLVHIVKRYHKTWSEGKQNRSERGTV